MTLEVARGYVQATGPLLSHANGIQHTTVFLDADSEFARLELLNGRRERSVGSG